MRAAASGRQRLVNRRPRLPAVPQSRPLTNPVVDYRRRWEIIIRTQLTSRPTWSLPTKSMSKKRHYKQRTKAAFTHKPPASDGDGQVIPASLPALFDSKHPLVLSIGYVVACAAAVFGFFTAFEDHYSRLWFICLVCVVAVAFVVLPIWYFWRRGWRPLLLTAIVVVCSCYCGMTWYRYSRPADRLQALIPFSSDTDSITFVLGNNRFSWPRDDFAGGPKRMPAPVNTYTNWNVHLGLVRGGLYINATLPDERGEPIIVIQTNRIAWKGPPGWDCNIGTNAIEVVDERLIPRLQLYRIGDATVALNAALPDIHGRMWYISEEHGLNSLVGSFKRIFKYPSWRHPGKLLGDETMGSNIDM